MPETKRKIRRNRKSRILKSSIVTGFFVLLFAVGLYFFLKSTDASLLSPLPPNYKINSESDKDREGALIKKKLKEKNIDFDSISQRGSNITVRLKDKSEIIFSADKDIDSQIASLQFILARLTMEGKLFKSLDLRFDKPVIK